METQQSYKFLTDLGLAQYDATVRQYMEQTFAKKDETPSGGGINIVKAACHSEGESDVGEYVIDSIDTEPQQIWDFLNEGKPIIIVAEIASSDIVRKVILIPGDYYSAVYGDKIEKLMTFVNNREGLRYNMSFFSEEPNEWNYELYAFDTTKTSLIDYTDWLTLKEMRDAGKLIRGRQYCIYDYEFRCSQYGINSANLSFGILLTADDAYTLNENAHAVDLGYGYLQDCNLNAWELKYCLDNDIDRFGWASPGLLYYSTGSKQLKCPLIGKTDSFWMWQDGSSEKALRLYTVPNPSSGDKVFKEQALLTPVYAIDGVEPEGKGVIYWMRDEWGNEAPYDFKNALFNGHVLGLTDYMGTPLTDYYYTFSIDNGSIMDASTLKFTGSELFYGSPITKNNIITPGSNNKTIPVNIFFAKDSFDITGVQGIIGNEIGIDSTGNLFFENCTFNKLGPRCKRNKFAEYCTGNIMSDQCCNVILGQSSHDNIFKGYCSGVQGNLPLGMAIFKNCEFGANISMLSFNKHSPISDTIVGNNVRNIDPSEWWYNYWWNGLPKFIGLGNDGKPHCVQGIDGFGGGSNTAPLRVAVTLDESGEFKSADHYLGDIRDAINQNRSVFIHVALANGKELFLQLSEIVETGAMFSTLTKGVYFACWIEENPANCYFTQKGW